jgi:hypothetical protein
MDYRDPSFLHFRDRFRELKNRKAGNKTGTGWFPGAAGEIGDEK